MTNCACSVKYHDNAVCNTPNCGCWCHTPTPHRGSRPHMDEDPVREAPAEPIDRMFQEAAAAGFKPVTEEQAQAMREKLRGVSAQIRDGH